MTKRTKAVIALASSMLLFSTIGFFRNEIPLPSSLVACVRGIIGSLLIILFMALTNKRFDWEAFRKDWKTLILSGAMIGANWALLFEAYRETTIAVATICYYMAPIFLTLGSFLFLKERISWKKMICIAIAFCGTLSVSGVFGGEGGNFKGILLGLGAAVLYGGVMMLNQKLKAYPTFDRTIVQLMIAGIVMIPYGLLTEDVSVLSCDTKGYICLAILCLVHTAFAYILFFSSMPHVDAQTVAVYCYIDPVMAVVLSALVFREELGITGIVGAILILGAAFTSEWIGSKSE